MAEHGTRTMYVHYKCRCDACCKAEHEQYLKRAKNRVRTSSKWGDSVLGQNVGRIERHRLHNKIRYSEYLQTAPYRKRIRWKDIIDSFDSKCAICGCFVDQNDFWINEKGRKCFGRKYPTVDHIVSLKNGGKDSLDNVQLLCKRCNSIKGKR